MIISSEGMLEVRDAREDNGELSLGNAEIIASEIFLKAGASVQVQSVLYNNDFEGVRRSVESIARAAELAISDGICMRVFLSYGDCSPRPSLSNTQLLELKSIGSNCLEIEYEYFNENLGSAQGHNRLAASCDLDFLLIQNPDIVVSPRVFEGLLTPFRSPGIGMTEAKQLPIEHPKDYDRNTGETEWATTACAIIPVKLFNRLGGFDADFFFLYCDDVDFSWRVREAGFKILFLPSVAVFHDKRLSNSGKWETTAAERYYSAEAALFLTYKWSRVDLTSEHLSFFEAHGDENLKKAAKLFVERREKGDLPRLHDLDHKIAHFVGNYYARHRFDL